MIIKLNHKHHTKLIDYLNKEPEFNLFIKSDLDRYGYNNYFFNIWAEIDKNGEIVGVLVKCFEFITIYSYTFIDIEKFCNLINNMEFYQISGKSEIVDSIAKELRLQKVRKVNFCKLENKLNLIKDIEDIKFKKIKVGNIKKIVNLYKIIDEFENTTVEIIKSGLKTGRGYYIEVNKQAVAMAKSTSENETHAMIVGVGTNPKFRNKGYATKCVSKICIDLLNENKIPCLFYDNEKAGKIYKSLGFTKMGNWSIYSR